jgi:hypothetical protein
VFLVSLTGCLFTCFPLLLFYLAHLLVILSQISVQQPISENGSELKKETKGIEMQVQQEKTLENMKK